MGKCSFSPRDYILSFLKGAPLLPEFVEIFLTNSCNHNCTFCISESYRLTKQQFPWSRMRALIHELKSGGTKYLRVCGGGEPLIYQGLLALFEECHRVGLTTFLVTNASLMTEKVVHTIAKTCSHVKVSLDAGDEISYTQTHRVESNMFARVLDNILALSSVKQGKDSCKIELSFVLCEENFRSLQDFILLAADLQVDLVSISTNTLDSEQGNEQYLTYALQMLKQMNLPSDLPIRLHNSSPDEFLPDCDLFCPLILFNAAITAHGDVYPSCHHVRFPEHKMGNITKAAFADLLRSRRVLSYLMNYAFGSADKCRKLLISRQNLQLVQMMRSDQSCIELLRKHQQDELDVVLAS